MHFTVLYCSKFLEQPEITLLLVKENRNTSQTPGNSSASGSRSTQCKETTPVCVWLRTGECQGAGLFRLWGVSSSHTVKVTEIKD